jgi:hypothetical protein
MGSYWSEIYTIQNGEFVLLESGQWSEMYNHDWQEGDPEEDILIYSWYWNGTEVSFHEYNQFLSTAFDDTRADFSGFYTRSYDQVIERLLNYDEAR